jgi:hypothetical protein
MEQGGRGKSRGAIRAGVFACCAVRFLNFYQRFELFLNLNFDFLYLYGPLSEPWRLPWSTPCGLWKWKQ